MAPPTADDLLAERIARAKDGNRDELDALLLDHQQQLLGYIEAKMPPRLRASRGPEDLLQDSYRKAFTAIASFDYQGPHSFLAWLKRIASNTLIDASRKKKLPEIDTASTNNGASDSYRPLINDVARQSLGPDGKAMVQEMKQAFYVALARLPEDYRTALELHYLQNRSLDEVADTLQRGSDATRGVVHRARKKLQEEMDRLSRFV